MIRICLDDLGAWKRFAPLSLTRPIGDLRVGIFTNSERWASYLKAEIVYQTEGYLSKKFNSGVFDIRVNASLIPDSSLMDSISQLSSNQKLMFNSTFLAGKGDESEEVEWNGDEPLLLKNRWDIYQQNGRAIKQDFDWLTANRNSELLSSTNTIIGDQQLIFVEAGAKVEAAILNTSEGPIYIGEDAEIMEGSIIRGPFSMGEHSALKLGTKVYGPTTLGPHCKVGGEVNNVVFQAYSNKGHDGFLGNSLIGEWCNLGADTNSSNLKNNYGYVSTYDYETKNEEGTNVQFMGLSMGDHSKCGINTMFNTATVVGVSCNVFGAEFPNKYIPSFSWGGTNCVPFKLDKAIEYANNMMARRGLQLTNEEIAILHFVQENY